MTICNPLKTTKPSIHPIPVSHPLTQELFTYSRHLVYPIRLTPSHPRRQLQNRTTQLLIRAIRTVFPVITARARLLRQLGQLAVRPGLDPVAALACVATFMLVACDGVVIEDLVLVQDVIDLVLQADVLEVQIGDVDVVERVLFMTAFVVLVFVPRGGVAVKDLVLVQDIVDSVLEIEMFEVDVIDVEVVERFLFIATLSACFR